MYLAVIACPNVPHNFDGKIFLKRVAREKVLARGTVNERFVDSVGENERIKRDWRDVVDASMTAAQMTVTVAKAFDFENQEITKRLVIRYIHYTTGGKVTWKELPKAKSVAGISIRGKGDVTQRPLTVDDLVFQVQWKKGDKVMEDVNCNSEFMLKHMNTIGKAIRDSHHCIGNLFALS
jgi:hypothetical protein